MGKVKKRYISLSISILAAVVLMLSSTYALYRYFLGDTEVAFDAHLGIIYNKEHDTLTGTLTDVANKDEGSISTTIELWTTTTRTPVYGSLSLNVTNISSPLNTNGMLKYEVWSNGQLIKRGNFNDINSGDSIDVLFEQQLNTVQTFYTIYVWLDKNYVTTAASGSSFSATVSASAGQEKSNFDLLISSNIGTFSNGLYNVSTNCSNAGSGFDTKTQTFWVSNLSGSATCTATFTEDNTEYPTLYEQIVSDWNETDGTKNIYKEEHDYDGDDNTDYYEYRYEGTDTEVENYVWFNNELWRIIGAFPGGTPSTVTEDGTFVQGDAAPSTENTVKIIRNDVIGSFAWDKNNTNNWNTAELNTNILNNLYLNSSSGTCNFYSTSVSKPCSFESNGLGNVGDYLAEVTWNLGGCSSTTNPTDMYKYERGTNVYSSTSNPRPYLTTAKVGLMYSSDYGYSTSSDSCQTGTNLSGYGSCGRNGWLLKNGYEWIQLPDSSYSSYVWNVSSVGYVHRSYADSGFGVRPVVYLNSNIYVTGGSGSINNPYQIRVGG